MQAQPTHFVPPARLQGLSAARRSALSASLQGIIDWRKDKYELRTYQGRNIPDRLSASCCVLVTTKIVLEVCRNSPDMNRDFPGLKGRDMWRSLSTLLRTSVNVRIAESTIPVFHPLGKYDALKRRKTGLVEAGLRGLCRPLLYIVWRKSH